MNNIVIETVNGGLGRLPASTDGIIGILGTGVAVSGGVQLQTVYRMTSLDDAVALGIDADYDTTNVVLVYEQIQSFFRNNPNSELWFLLDDQTASMDELFTNVSCAKKLMDESEGRISLIGAFVCPTAGITTVAELNAAIAAAQTFAQTMKTAHTPVHVILEGRGVTTVTAENLHLKNSNHVSVMCGQNLEVAASNIIHKTYGAIGTILNVLSIGRVNENVGYVRKFNVQGGNLNFISVNAGVLTSSQESALNDKGLIFFRKHPNIAGIYFNDSFTATALTDDLFCIENNRVMNKAIRLIQQALIPDLNSPVSVNAQTGQLSAEIVKKLEAQGKRAIDEGLLNNSEISGFSFIIDPNQNILTTSQLVTELSIVPTGTARSIKVKIGFTNPF